MGNQPINETKTHMNTMTKIAIAAAITAAVVFPGVAALAATPANTAPAKAETKRQEVKDRIQAQREKIKKQQEEQKACRENNKKIQAEFNRAQKAAEELKRQAIKQASKNFTNSVRESKGDKTTKEAALNAKNTAIKSAQEKFQAAKDAARAAREKHSKKCTPATLSTDPASVK